MTLKYLIMCRSLTYAQRSARALENVGITAVVTKAPQSVSAAGCAYCIKVSEKRVRDAVRVLREAGLEPSKLFMQGPGGSVTEMSL